MLKHVFQKFWCNFNEFLWFLLIALISDHYTVICLHMEIIAPFCTTCKLGHKNTGEMRFKYILLEMKDSRGNFIFMLHADFNRQVLILLDFLWCVNCRWQHLQGVYKYRWQHMRCSFSSEAVGKAVTQFKLCLCGLHTLD